MQQGGQSDWENRRAILSGLTLVAGYGLETYGVAQLLFLPFYVVAMLLGGWGNFRKAAIALPRGNFNISVLMSVAWSLHSCWR